VPAQGANGVNAFATLNQAISVAVSGDVIQIEPGSKPGTGLTPTSNLTIQGDPFAGAAGLLASASELGSFIFSKSNSTLSNLALSRVTMDAGATGETIRNCIISQEVSQIFSAAANGGNTITGNFFSATVPPTGSSSVIQLGNTAGSATN